MADEEATPEELTPAEIDRMWQHGLHLDAMLFQRGNLFLVAESLLVVAYTGLLPGSGSAGAPILAACVVAVFGLLLTCVWAYVGHRHLQYLALLNSRVRDHVREYRALRERWHPKGPSSLPLVTYTLPALAAVMWIILLLIALSR